MKFEIKKDGEIILSKELSEGSYKIGRASDCDIVLDSTRVSKHHALLVVRGNRAAILDTDSANGVFVNGVLVKKKLLNKSDVIEIGEFKLKNPAPQKVKRSLEVSGTRGSLALEQQSELESVPMEENLVSSEGMPEEALKPAANLASLVDKKLLIPFYEVIRVTDYRFVMAMLLVLSIGCASFFSITPILAWSNSVFKEESLKRGHTILKQMVRENYRILIKTKDTTSLTTAAAESEKDLIEAYVVDLKTKSVLAPVKYLSKSLNDPYVLIAIEDIQEKKLTEVTKDRGDGTYVLVQSIPYNSANEQLSEFEQSSADSNTPSLVIIGYYRIPKAIIGIYEPMAVSGLIALLLALVAFFFIFKMISRPIIVLQEQLDLALKGEVVELKSTVKFPEFEKLTTEMNFALSKMKSSGGGLAPNPSGVPGGFDTESESNAFFKTMEEFCYGSTDGVLVLDLNKTIKFISPVLADLISLRPQYAIGQNVGDACRDGSFAGTVIELAEKVVSSFGESQNAQLEINGISRNLTAVCHKYSNGEMAFTVVTVKMNA